jgi:DNA helicase-2/ATP-dependent DNA helicase PcrA
MTINDDHIREAESILIDGRQFDEERRLFIKCLDTIDLLAVPGSGKTTALLAKLYCMARQLPLHRKRGILVLSHTNHTIDQIEKYLKPFCPQLFGYPHFIGTIQSFVNRFVANVACFQLYGSYIHKNDDDVFRGVLANFLSDFTLYETLHKYLFRQIISSCGNKKEVISITRKVDYIMKFKPDYENSRFSRPGQPVGFKTKVGNQLLGLFESIFRLGILRYQDSFTMAERYLKQNRQLEPILRERFGFIFIDEMQDLDKAQIELLENIFYNPASDTVIQRIGDKNQSIYSRGTINDKIVWRSRHEQDPKRFPKNYTLTKSHRLPKKIAELVDCFVLKRDDKRYKVEGASNNVDISPHLLIYQNEKDAQILKDKFIELIKKYNLHQSQKNVERGFHIIAWTVEKDGQSDKWHLKKLFPEFSKVSRRQKEDFECLSDYLLHYNKQDKTFKSIKSNLLNGILGVLRHEQYYDQTTPRRHFTKRTFLQRIAEKGDDEMIQFNKRLFSWCFGIIVKNDPYTTFADYKSFIESELNDLLPGLTVNGSRKFIDGDYDKQSQDRIFDPPTPDNDINVNLGSIHSVKGQTHCATMYIETDYFGSEIDKIFHKNTEKNPLLFEEQKRKGENNERFNTTLKMMYVGFSRPTHLLCLAVRKEKIINYVDKFRTSGWEIIEINQKH